MLHGLPWWLSGQESACNTGARGDTDSIPGSGRSPGGKHGNLLRYSCLENPTDREAWWAPVHRVTRSWTRLKRLSMDAHTPIWYIPDHRSPPPSSTVWVLHPPHCRAACPEVQLPPNPIDLHNFMQFPNSSGWPVLSSFTTWLSLSHSSIIGSSVTSFIKNTWAFLFSYFSLCVQMYPHIHTVTLTDGLTLTFLGILLSKHLANYIAMFPYLSLPPDQGLHKEGAGF